MEKKNTDGTIIQFLNGSHSFYGVWFGEQHPAHKGHPFWWRKFLPADQSPEEETLHHTDFDTVAPSWDDYNEHYAQDYSGKNPPSAERVDRSAALPTDKEVQDWYVENIDMDCSPSSAIYKFRLWLRDRTQSKAHVLGYSRESLVCKVQRMEISKGVKGATYGDTQYDSVSY